MIARLFSQHPGHCASGQAAEASKAATAMALGVTGECPGASSYGGWNAVGPTIWNPAIYENPFFSTSAGSTRCQNVVFQMASTVRPDINYLNSLTDSKLGLAGSPSCTSSAQRTLPSPLQQAFGPSGGSSGGMSHQVLNLLSMPDRNFMDGFTCHASVQPGMLRVWMKILQQGPSSAKFRIIALPPGYDAGELLLVMHCAMTVCCQAVSRHQV